MPYRLKLAGKGDFGDQLRAQHLRLMIAWQPRFVTAYAKRFGSLMRGRSAAAVPKRTGRLRRGIKTRGVADPQFALRGRGHIGRVEIESGGPHANVGTIGLVLAAVGRIDTGAKAQKALRAVVRGTLRKTLRERAARE